MRAKFINEAFKVLRGPSDKEVEEALAKIRSFEELYDMLDDLPVTKIVKLIQQIIDNLDNIYEFADAKFQYMSEYGDFGWARNRVKFDINKLLSNNMKIPIDELPDDDLNLYALILEEFNWRGAMEFLNIKIENNKLYWETVDYKDMDENWMYATKEILKTKDSTYWIARPIMNAEDFLYALAEINEVEWNQIDILD